jgi:cell wall-associated NlpC family hydrolase
MSRSIAVALENTCAALVGVPFKDGGRDPNIGFDCWGLVAFVFTLRGIPVEDYLISATESAMIDGMIAMEASARWKPIGISELEELDVLTFRLDQNHPKFVTHVGIYVGCGRFLHSLEKIGVNQSRLDDLYWKARFAGAYRRKA